jgi:hypothetical protein
MGAVYLYLSICSDFSCENVKIQETHLKWHSKALDNVTHASVFGEIGTKSLLSA